MAKKKKGASYVPKAFPKLKGSKKHSKRQTKKARNIAERVFF